MCTLGSGGGIRIIRLGGFLSFLELLPYIPQREAGEALPPRRKEGKGISPGKFPRDRPDPMEEPPPQDDDPNSSTLDPMSFALLLPAVFCEKSLFLKNRGWAGRCLFFAQPAFSFRILNSPFRIWWVSP